MGNKTVNLRYSKCRILSKTKIFIRKYNLKLDRLSLIIDMVLKE